MVKNEKDFSVKQTDQQERVIKIDRVTKVVKGGKNLNFRATVVVGNLKGSVGVGVSKSAEVPKAIRKAIEKAKKLQKKVPIVGTSIAHEVIGCEGAAKVKLRPAKKGTGVIAGGAVRSVLELAGIKDIVAKVMGSKSMINNAKATVNGLCMLQKRDEIEKLRDVKLTLRNVSEGTIESSQAKPKQKETAKKEETVEEKVEVE